MRPNYCVLEIRLPATDCILARKRVNRRMSFHPNEIDSCHNTYQIDFDCLEDPTWAHHSLNRQRRSKDVYGQKI